MLRCGDKFRSYEDLHNAVLAFQQAEFVQLYHRRRDRRSRKTDSSSGRAPRKNFNPDLVYSEIDYACQHGGKKFKTTSTGKRPNQR